MKFRFSLDKRCPEGYFVMKKMRKAFFKGKE